MAQQRVLQLPKFAVVEVMIELDGRNALSSDRWDVRDRFWRDVLAKLNDLHPENQSEVRTVNHVKRTWCALKQRVIARAKNAAREVLPSDRKVLYLLQVCDGLSDDSPIHMDRLDGKLGADSDLALNGPPASANLQLPKNVEPLLDAMIVCGGRNTLPKKRSTTISGKNRLKANECNGSFVERKAFYLMRVMTQQQARFKVEDGVIYDAIDDPTFGPVKMEGDAAQGSHCEVIRQEPLDLAKLIAQSQLDMQSLQNSALSPSLADDETPLGGDEGSSIPNEDDDVSDARSLIDDDGTPTSTAFARSSSADNTDLQKRLLLCQIEREKAQTELLNAQRRLVEAQLQGLIQLNSSPLNVELGKNLMENF